MTHEYNLSRAQAEVVGAWLDAKAMARKYGDEEKALRARIVDFIRDPDDDSIPAEVYTPDGHLAIRPKVIETQRFDSKALKAAYPGIYDQYLTTSTQTRMETP